LDAVVLPALRLQPGSFLTGQLVHIGQRGEFIQLVGEEMVELVELVELVEDEVAVLSSCASS
jgi:hypothetical protein